ncbi:unnamed protein product [Strongylus vulgaris]|uniref:BTB domain-containing protein n=1 Tax=Strongylus vulgaris TaxID=40348 RepID=A0A3P7JFR1_STRVU|nr:unnamed protein product [Strongylus vulgaris]
MCTYLDPDEEVKLNVGGEIFAPKVANLTRIPGTFLARMVDRTWKTSVSEPIFIDRDPKYFGLLLEFLATGNVELPRSDIELAAIIQEAEVSVCVSDLQKVALKMLFLEILTRREPILTKMKLNSEKVYEFKYPNQLKEQGVRKCCSTFTLGFLES